jgi:hypothetical protein
MSDFRYLDALLQPKFGRHMLYRLTARRRAYEVSIIFSVCLLKPFSVFNHAERGFFYGQYIGSVTINLAIRCLVCISRDRVTAVTIG